MDVERTLKRFPPSKHRAKPRSFVLIDLPEDYSDADRIQLQEELIIIVVKMLIKHEHLNYYQVKQRKLEQK